MGKHDVILGSDNYNWIEADEVGVWRGQCAEYCGLYHAIMEFRVVARPADELADRVVEMQAVASQR